MQLWLLPARWLTAVIILCVMSPASAQLKPCPGTPNCVSSLATDSDQHIEALAFTMPASEALARLRQVLLAEPRTIIVKEEGGYLHAEARSFLFRFVDDVEFLLDADQQLIHVRSASRTGYSDLGVNRRRVERIRRAFNDTP